jgi:hypothetical protein
MVSAASKEDRVLEFKQVSSLLIDRQASDEDFDASFVDKL